MKKVFNQRYFVRDLYVIAQVDVGRYWRARSKFSIDIRGSSQHQYPFNQVQYREYLLIYLQPSISYLLLSPNINTVLKKYIQIYINFTNKLKYFSILTQPRN